MTNNNNNDMANITLPNVRIESDVKLNATLKDNGVAVDWSGLTDISAALYSDTQRQVAGVCTTEISTEDSRVLICRYEAGEPQYLGPQRLVVRCRYQGQRKTYDAPAFNFVPLTGDLEGQELELSDPEVDVAIEVTEVSTSLLDRAIDAAFSNAALAAEAAEHAPMIGTNGNWHVWDSFTGSYEDTGVRAEGEDGEDGAPGPKGDTGEKGESGGLLYPTFDVDAAMHLRLRCESADPEDRFALGDDGHLSVNF